MRVVVLGGTGNFGARIVRALQSDGDLQLLATGRRIVRIPGAEQTPVVALDLAANDFEAKLKTLEPHLVVHAVGPFQGQDYRVARATLGAGAHYIDLADGRDFVSGFAAALDSAARQAGRVAIAGASTLPALSSAVVDALVSDGLVPEIIETSIAPGQRAARGEATLRAVFSYLGKPVRIWESGQWRSRTGWMDLRRVPLAFGTRWGALCDVPDLALFPERYPTVRSTRFHAALELKLQHLVLWGLAALIRLGLPVPIVQWCGSMDRLASAMDRFGGEWGGMRVSVVGFRNGRRLRRTWLLTAPALNGPEIPCMATISLVRGLAGGDSFAAGARACMGLIPLEAFRMQFHAWGIRTQILEEPV